MDLSWRMAGRCRDHDPEMFFPPKGREFETARRHARKVCNGGGREGLGPCTVRQMCLDFAVDAKSFAPDDGIWGGMTPRERKRYSMKGIVPRLWRSR